jgi:hypothetical protein
VIKRRLKHLNQRSSALRRLAIELDLEFREQDPFHDLALLRHFRFYRRTTRNRKVFNILYRQSEMLENTLQIFDLEWIVSTGKSTQIFQQTTLFLRSRDLMLPDFYLRPEHFFHRIGAWLGMQDIDFVQYPEFSAANLLRGEDEQLVRELVVRPELAKMFRVNRDWFVEGMGYYLVLYQRNRLLNPEEIRELIVKGMELFAVLRENPSP